jgi:hypothetical protein
VKRAGRWLFNFAATVSLVLFLATTILWVRSYWRCDFVARSDADGRDPVPIGGSGFALPPRAVFSNYGRILLRVRSDSPQVRHHHWDYSVGTQPIFVSFGMNFFAWQFNSDLWAIQFPHALPAAIFAIAPALWLLNIGRRRRIEKLNQGLCPTCGYDLRATPDRCPECGTRVPPPPEISIEIPQPSPR